MSKIELDKYYTPDELAKYCVKKTKEIIGDENITEYLEPSAGSGVFLKYLDKTYLAYDIKPEGEGIIKQDYLTLDLEYKKGRCVIGNPPYGNGNTLSVKFYKKAIKECDYISFIQSISQLNNNQQMYEFDLIYSEDLGLKEYSGVKLHCCLNIYKRPLSNKLNKKPNYKLKDVKLIEVRKRNNKLTKQINYNDYDIGICNAGSVGSITKYVGQYVNEIYIKVLNEKYKNKVLKLIKETNWKELLNNISKPYITVTNLYKYIKEQIPEIE